MQKLSVTVSVTDSFCIAHEEVTIFYSPATPRGLAGLLHLKLNQRKEARVVLSQKSKRVDANVKREFKLQPGVGGEIVRYGASFIMCYSCIYARSVSHFVSYIWAKSALCVLCGNKKPLKTQ